jgi:hypothetical protein
MNCFVQDYYFLQTNILEYYYLLRDYLLLTGKQRRSILEPMKLSRVEA